MLLIYLFCVRIFFLKMLMEENFFVSWNRPVFFWNKSFKSIESTSGFIHRRNNNIDCKTSSFSNIMFNMMFKEFQTRFCSTTTYVTLGPHMRSISSATHFFQCSQNH